MNNNKYKTITKNVLAYLLEVADGLAEVPISRKGAYNALQKKFGGPDYSKMSFNKTLSNLKGCGYIETEDHGQSIVLTDKAKMKMIDQITAKLEKDHKFNYIVSFDIPEDLRAQRNAFRRTIKKLGFVQIQKSLWVTDKNVGDFVELASYEYKVENYVAYFVCIKSNIDFFIKKKLTKK